MPNNRIPSSDLRGAGSLSADAIKGITELVEAMHHTITSLGGLLGDSGQQQTTGITGMVYRNIRTVSDLVGGGIDILLDKLACSIGKEGSSLEREAILAALNGVLGDHLVARNNPLAIPMQFRRGGTSLDEKAIMELVQQSNGKLAIMVHGSCLNDLQWRRKGHDHGAALARDLGLVPLYLHYNSGLHVSENGKKFSELLESVVVQLSKPITIYLITHSMGGLVSRSACFYGKRSKHNWLDSLRKIVFLGTPHHGSPLEKGGNWIDTFLALSPYSAPFSRLGKIRSCGVTDLRYGNIIDEDWEGRDRFDYAGDHRTPVPLPDNVECYTIGVTTAKGPSKLGDDLIGDGLVVLDSALGRHRNPKFNLKFPKDHQWIGRSLNHLELFNNPDIYKVIKSWIED